MMSRPLFTIGVVTRNRWGLLAQALTSVREQGFDDLEIVVVDWTARVLMSGRNIPALQELPPGYLVRSFRATTRFERPQEPELRADALSRILDDHHDGIAALVPDIDYEKACRFYLSSSGILARMGRISDLWRERAKYAVAADGELMDLFVQHIEGRAKPQDREDAHSDPYASFAKTAPPAAISGNDVMNVFLKGNEPGSATRQWHNVAFRRRALPDAYANPHQLVAGNQTSGAPAPEDLSIYALDVRNQAWNVCDVPTPALLDGAAFAYQDQFAAATRVASVPWGGLVTGDARAAVLVFSIGRCGSTLAGQLLGAAGYSVASEFDSFTQIGLLARALSGRKDFGDAAPRLERLFEEQAAQLAHAADAPLAIKMRAQANDALGLLSPDRHEKILFLVRDLPGWARSQAAHFPAVTAQGLADSLLSWLRALDTARQRGLDVTLVHYADFRDGPAALIKHIGIENTDAIREAGKSPSQQGTHLETPRRDPSGRDVKAVVEAVLDRWKSLETRDLTTRLGLTPRLERAA